MPSPLTDDLVLRMMIGSHSFASNARGMGIRSAGKACGRLCPQKKQKEGGGSSTGMRAWDREPIGGEAHST